MHGAVGAGGEVAVAAGPFLGAFVEEEDAGCGVGGGEGAEGGGEAGGARAEDDDVPVLRQ